MDIYNAQYLTVNLLDFGWSEEYNDFAIMNFRFSIDQKFYLVRTQKINNFYEVKQCFLL